MRVLIADDHGLFRDGMRSLLEARGIAVVDEARDGGEALELALRLRPDVVLMDLAMPRMGGLEATRLLSAQAPAISVIVVTASDDDADLFEAIKSGAQGYIFKNLEAEQFFPLLEGVTRGEPALTPKLAAKLLREFAHPAPARREGAPQEGLTAREREVLELLVAGVTTNHDLAARLVVSENTVRYHLRNILDKLHVRNRAQVIAYAVRAGLVAQPRPGQSHPEG